MKELLRNKEKGYVSTISYDIKQYKDRDFIIFVQKDYTDNNKWKKPQVVSDMFIQSYNLPKGIFSDLPETIEKTVKINGNEILEYLLGYLDEAANNFGGKVDKIQLSLPTGRFATPFDILRYKDTFLPLIVKIDEKDVSRCFQDFDCFKEKTVEKAYEALIDGNIPEINSDLFDKEGINNLHNELFMKEKENEG